MKIESFNCLYVEKWLINKAVKSNENNWVLKGNKTQDVLKQRLTKCKKP